jgi:hypothetical protein
VADGAVPAGCGVLGLPPLGEVRNVLEFEGAGDGTWGVPGPFGDAEGLGSDGGGGGGGGEGGGG